MWFHLQKWCTCPTCEYFLRNLMFSSKVLNDKIHSSCLIRPVKFLVQSKLLFKQSRRALPLSHCCHQMSLWCYSVGSYVLSIHLTSASQYHPNNAINPVIVPQNEQHRPNFILMDEKAPTHQCRIIKERQLETGEPWMEWPALSTDLSPPENLWDQLSHHAESRNSGLQNLNDLQDCQAIKVGCHVSTDNDSTCVQHEMSLSRWDWWSRTHDMSLRHWDVFVVACPPLCWGGNHFCMISSAHFHCRLDSLSFCDYCRYSCLISMYIGYSFETCVLIFKSDPILHRHARQQHVNADCRVGTIPTGLHAY